MTTGGPWLKRLSARLSAIGQGRRLRPLYEAADHFLLTPGTVTEGAPHVRDVFNLKRMMITVVFALIPVTVMAFYNTGLQANLALQALGELYPGGWRGAVLEDIGVGLDPGGMVGNFVHGALYFLPIYLVTLAVGGAWETVFAMVRGHAISEGFLVTSLLFALIMPPGLPLWQAALGISFGVVVGKEIFGGVGMNILNPALTGRCFLFFAYPRELSGDTVWVAVDGYSRATPLAALADPTGLLDVSWGDAFLGLMPGSMGETSTLACLIGAALLLITRVGSWRIMLSVLLGMAGLAGLFNWVGSDSNPLFQVSPLWHLVLGGFAFGTVFMATDPVSAAHSEGGQIVYGLLIGMLTVLVRVINPAFPEGIMLAILFGNVFAPAIDRFFVLRNVRRRQRRQARDGR